MPSSAIVHRKATFYIGTNRFRLTRSVEWELALGDPSKGAPRFALKSAYLLPLPTLN